LLPWLVTPALTISSPGAPSRAQAWGSFGLLLSLACVVGLAKLISPALEQLVLDLQAPTFIVGSITLASGRTNLMQGAVHLVLFAAFLFLTLVP
jgi:Ca2+/H+ antiporter